MKKTTLLPVRLLARRACLWAALGFLSALAFVAPQARAAVTEVCCSTHAAGAATGSKTPTR